MAHVAATAQPLAAAAPAHAEPATAAPLPSYSGRPARVATVRRKTKETEVEVTLNLDGTGVCVAETPVGFLNHMLDQIASHGLIDVTVRATGDTWIDDHHTVEDIALAFGGALSAALGDRKGIHRFGEFSAPLDEALTHVVLDLSGRPHLSCDLAIPAQRIGTFDTELVEHFFMSLSNTGGVTLHIRQLAGRNSHHIVEATFKVRQGGREPRGNTASGRVPCDDVWSWGWAVRDGRALRACVRDWGAGPSPPRHGTAQHSTAQHSTAQHSTPRHAVARGVTSRPPCPHKSLVAGQPAVRPSRPAPAGLCAGAAPGLGVRRAAVGAGGQQQGRADAEVKRQGGRPGRWSAGARVRLEAASGGAALGARMGRRAAPCCGAASSPAAVRGRGAPCPVLGWQGGSAAVGSASSRYGGAAAHQLRSWLCMRV
jgi:imidazoleglycerol-phosphate dehydratase